VATIGVTQVVVALGLLLPRWLGSGNVAAYPPFINLSFTVGKGLDSTVFSGHDVMVLIVVPLVLIALTAFFRFTSIGVALRATAEDADRASLLGIPVRRLQSVVWGLASLLAFLAMFMKIGVDGPTLGQVLDPTLLLSARRRRDRPHGAPADDHAACDRPGDRLAGRGSTTRRMRTARSSSRRSSRSRSCSGAELVAAGERRHRRGRRPVRSADPGRAPPPTRGAGRPVGARRAAGHRPRTDPDHPAGQPCAALVTVIAIYG
jgi:hypothetical protein